LLFILSDSFLFLMMRLSTVAVTLLTICFLAAAATGSAASAQVTPPPRVRIGGFFAPVSPSGALYVSQAEHLAAFVMAARDINDKTDGIFDDVLVGTDFQIAVGIENSLSSAAVNAVQLGTAFGGQGVEVAVSALRNGNAPVVAQLLSSLNTLTVLSDTDSAVFNNFALYPYVANVRPLVSRQGMVIQNMICQSDVRKIVVFAGTDVDNIHMMSQFQDESICDLDILAVITIRADLNDMSLEIERAKAMGSRYFIQFLPAHQLASLIEQGYAANLFRDNTVMYTSSHSIVNITNHFSPDTDVAQVMTGLFYFKYIPNYYMERSSEGISFARRWREQPSRAGQVVNGLQVCDATKDSTGANYLYQSTMKSNVTVCTGLDFASYDESGSNIHPYTAITYDSTIYVALALDYAIRNGLDYNNPTTLLDIMVSNVSFHGATGPLDLFKGYPMYGYDGRGVRSAGTQYRAYNFNPTLYTNGSENFMVNVGTFDGDTRVYTPCEPVDHVTCFPAWYTTATDGSQYFPASDTPPVIIFQIPDAFTYLCDALALIIALLVLGFGVFTFVNRRNKIIKASQPMLLWCILLGGMLAAIRIFMGGVPNSDSTCANEVWFGHLAFVVMIGSLFVKSYRVHCIVNTRKLVRVTFSAMHAFRILVAIVSATIVYLIATQLVGHPIMRADSSTVANQQTDVQYCALEYPQFQTALFVLEGFLLAISFRVCWEIRNVPDIVNESKQISTAMSAIVMVSVLILPIVYFLGLDHYTQDFVASFGFGFGAIVTLTLLFVPKIMVKYHLNSARISAKVAVEAILSSKGKYANSGNGNAGAPTNAEDAHAREADMAAQELLKGKTKEEKLFVCQEQLRRWQALVLIQQRAALNSNSHSTSSNVNSSHGMSVSGAPIQIDPELMSSMMEVDPEFAGLREELIAFGDSGGVPAVSCAHQGSVRPFSASSTVHPGSATCQHGLMVQDV
jgi:hypothetical protein